MRLDAPLMGDDRTHRLISVVVGGVSKRMTSRGIRRGTKSVAESGRS